MFKKKSKEKRLSQFFFASFIVLSFVALSLMMMVATPLHAQDQNQQQDQQATETTEPSDAGDAKPATETSKPSTPDEVFIPSEELSEDSSAPFPVDI